MNGNSNNGYNSMGYSDNRDQGYEKDTAQWQNISCLGCDDMRTADYSCRLERILGVETPVTFNTLKSIERSDQRMVEINIEKIPPEEIKAMARCLLASMTEFYSDPENQRKYLEWKEQRKSA